MSDTGSALAAVCEKLGLTMLPWQREFTEAVLAGEQVVLCWNRKMGWTTVQRVIETTKEEKW